MELVNQEIRTDSRANIETELWNNSTRQLRQIVWQEIDPANANYRVCWAAKAQVRQEQK